MSKSFDLKQMGWFTQMMKELMTSAYVTSFVLFAIVVISAALIQSDGNSVSNLFQQSQSPTSAAPTTLNPTLTPSLLPTRIPTTKAPTLAPV
jgi:biopolymer transport protein ExbB/TolQ